MEEDQSISIEQESTTFQNNNDNSSTNLSTALSPFNFICCHSCRRDFINSIDYFYLCSCSHHICSQCFKEEPNPKILTSQDPNITLILVCPVCKTRGKTVWLESNLQAVGMEGLRHCFRPVPDLIDDLRQSLEFQFGNVVEQVTYFKNKVIQQQQVLSRLSGEFKGIKELKSRNARLETENSSLRNELARVNQLLNESNSNTTDLNHKKQKSSDPNLLQSNRPSPRLGPQNSILPPGSKSIPSNLPLQPGRLSLDPSHTQLHASRQRQSNSKASSENRNTFETPTDMKERLSHFAYVPTSNQKQSPSRPPSTTNISHPSNNSNKNSNPPLQQSRPASTTNQYYRSQPQQVQSESYYQDPHTAPQFQYSLEEEQTSSFLPPQRSNSNFNSQRPHSTSLPASIIRGITPMPFQGSHTNQIIRGGTPFETNHQLNHIQYQPSSNQLPLRPPTNNNNSIQRRSFQSNSNDFDSIQNQQSQFQSIGMEGRGTPRPSSSGFRFREPNVNEVGRYDERSGEIGRRSRTGMR